MTLRALALGIPSVIGPRELAAIAGAGLLWWGLHSIYRPAAPVTFGLLLLWAAFGRHLVVTR